MSNVAKLKKKAAELEERRQYDKALSIYEQVLEQMGDSDEDADVSLFNRVGDLTLRQGRVTQAVSYYERAVDLYTDGGFLNNAIALCNKILRNAPGRTSIYYKLGRISARKGFTSDAKLNFLEYADRMQKGGQWEEAFSALEEFANLCPDQDDVRLMLAEQLTRRSRNPEALEQLQILYGKYRTEDRPTEANATLERMRSLDPNVVPRVSEREAPEKSGDLKFLDLSYDEPSAGGQPPPGGRARPFSHQPKGNEVAPDTPLPQRPVHDPRASGEMRVIDPLERPVNTGSGNDVVRSGEHPRSGGGSPRTVPRHDEPSLGDDPPRSDSAPMHDLALAGILPTLDTPGLPVPEPIPLAESAELDDLETPDPSILDIDYGGLLTSISEQGGGGRGEPGGIELLEIERTSSPDSMDLESRVTGTDLLVVHGAAQSMAPDGAEESTPDSDDPAALLVPNSGVEYTSALSHESLKTIATTEAEVQALLRDEPNDFALRRRLGEILVENGQRTEGLAELERAMIGFEERGGISVALAVAEEILRLEPNSIRHHQKRVEYSYRNNDQTLLIESYLELADALFRTSQLMKASVVYERVLELEPSNSRANYALAALLAGTTDKSAPVAGDAAPTTAAAGVAIAPGHAEKAQELSGDDESFVNLGDLLRADEVPRSTRMVVEDDAPSGDEQADFAEMLERFKRGLAENVDEEDYESHYDLGVAFREMGLLDEAIAQFQRALRGTRRRVRTLESLGQCFVERSQFQVAANVLERALNEGGADSGGDENLVGVLYLLGYSNEAMQKYPEALAYYQRLFMVDIQFRDVTTRIAALEKMVA